MSANTSRSSTLCFVTVSHRVSSARGPALEERQDIVYRDAPRSDAASPAPAVAEWQRTIPCDPVLLFRYSALTFNGHRIHYGRAYAIDEEGYSDLVMHGPPQAALLDLAAKASGSLPRSFEFRGVNPLFASASFTVNAARYSEGLRLWSADATGRTSMQATAVWS